MPNSICMSQRTWYYLAVVLVLGTALNFISHTDSLPSFARRSPANGGNPFQPQIPARDYRFCFAPDLLAPEQQHQVKALAVYGFGSRGETIVREVLPVEKELPELQYRFTTRLDVISVLFIDAQGQRLGRTGLVLPTEDSSNQLEWTFTSLIWSS